MAALNILVFGYNRPQHLENCLTAISKNKLADNANLIVCIDGCKDNATAEEKLNHANTTAVANSKQWCGHNMVVANETNMGLSAQYLSKIDFFLKQYESLVIVEDDIIVGINFLAYMDKALSLYGDKAGISMILGYVYTIDLLGKNNRSFFGKTSGNKAFAISRKFWSNNDLTCTGWEQLKTDKRLRRKYNTPGTDAAGLLIKELEGGLNKSWDSIVHWNCFSKNLLVLCPDQTLAIDNGWGGGGSNTFGENMFDPKVFDTNYEIKHYPQNIKEDKKTIFLISFYFAYILRFRFMIKRFKELF